MEGLLNILRELETDALRTAARYAVARGRRTVTTRDMILALR